jgi:ABC-type glycerol-3-phosphate transport system substrate-binding protein
VLYYNKTLADELAIKVPEDGMTWEQFINICSQVYQKTGKKTYGMPDQRMKNALETFLPAWIMTCLGEKSPPYPWTDTELLITEQDVVTFEEFILSTSFLLPFVSGRICIDSGGIYKVK